LLDLVRDANAEGLSIKAQVTSRPIGAFFGLDLSLNPFSYCPTYRAMAHLPLSQRAAEMRRAEVRARLLSEEPTGAGAEWIKTVRAVEEMVEFAEPVNYFPDPGKFLAVLAERQGVTPLEYAYDVLLRDDGHGILHYPATNYAVPGIGVTRAMMGHPYTVTGLGDGGAHMGMICDASVPTYLLTFWTRDVAPEERFTIPWAIHALTQRPAQTVGLRDRGVVAPGYKADLNVIDYDGLYLGLPHMVADLPSGGKRMMQHADGYEATILSGTVTYRDGVATQGLPGRLIRGAQPPPR
jgi:N-acyl-D-aspartate/D-glutamate deacylase